MEINDLCLLLDGQYFDNEKQMSDILALSRKAKPVRKAYLQLARSNPQFKKEIRAKYLKDPNMFQANANNYINSINSINKQKAENTTNDQSSDNKSKSSFKHKLGGLAINAAGLTGSVLLARRARHKNQISKRNHFIGGAVAGAAGAALITRAVLKHLQKKKEENVADK